MNLGDIKKFRSLISLLIAAIILGFVVGYLVKGETPILESAVSIAKGTAPGSVSDGSIYVCPMMCVPPMEKPGQCPVCGMELTAVPYDVTGEEGANARLKLSEHDKKTVALRTEPVIRKAVSSEVRLYGQIDYDPAHMSYVTAFMRGVIDRVYVKRAGQFVRWGDPLFDLYSSDLYDAAQQLMEAMKYVPSFLAFQTGKPHVAKEAPVFSSPDRNDEEDKKAQEQTAMQTIDAIRHKLRLLGMPKRDIDELMKEGEPTGIATVYAPMYGVVVEQKAFEGTYVNTGAPIFVLADPRYVWARLDAYETDYPWIRKGQEVSLQTAAYPGEVFKGKVVYIDPVLLDKESRTFKIGAVFPDRGASLKSGMIVRATIHAELNSMGSAANHHGKESELPLVVPASAPLITGKRAVVYVADANKSGEYEGREVVLGPRAGDYYIVREGLQEGEQVVVNGSFKIDSAVQILAKPSMMSLPDGNSAIEHQSHGGSEQMQEDYSAERAESRMVEDEEVKVEARENDYQRDRFRGLIQRRKPGQYGDTTRPRPSSQFQ